MATKKELEEQIKELEFYLRIEKEKNELKCPSCGCKSIPTYNTYKSNSKLYYQRQCNRCSHSFETDLDNKIIMDR